MRCYVHLGELGFSHKFSYVFTLYHRTLAPRSPFGPLAPPGACRQKQKNTNGETTARKTKPKKNLCWQRDDKWHTYIAVERATLEEKKRKIMNTLKQEKCLYVSVYE